MKCIYMLISVFLLGTASVLAQEEKAAPTHRGAQEIVRIVPQLLPQAIRDSISHHPIDKYAEVASAEQMSQNGNLVYKVNFLKDDKTWSKTFDVNGKHIDKLREDEEILFS